ncbi:T9SS type B sorting domain-containing protein [Chitinophaga flava]|uniref:Ig-like domain-containing protein n=1 Tax=Chitinophaga flava TaxID=2259036 RepID=A0A365XVR4_9BACT|nr:gliding motility-associated C-terminal domain-containing protein [Chitinophaga flava]RBL89675.1 hypothetical protein DF182_24570 [Chitinophaga flava]
MKRAIIICRKAYAVASGMLVMCISVPLLAQDIEIKNPSLEGPPRAAAAPPGWMIINNSPDIQPGCCSVSQPASHGSTYSGMISDATMEEGIVQHLSTGIKEGKAYAFSVDLAFPPVYFGQRTCSGAFIVYGGNKPGEKEEVLWKSPLFYHTNWKRYRIEFSAKKDYAYIMLCNYFTPCSSAKLSAVLVDNLSPAIQEIPKAVLTVQPTCKGSSIGTASVEVLGGPVPCTFRWKPGGQITSSLSNLAAGSYEVTITGFNGAYTTLTAVIGEEVLKNEIKVLPSRCYGDNQNEISLVTTGGKVPYRYYFNGSDHPLYTPQFRDLHPGKYPLLVKDEQGCATQELINVAEPPLLQITAALLKDVSCNDTHDGKIELQMAGGTPPYAYRLETGEWQSSNTWKQLDEGRYYYTVKDKNDCQVTGMSEIIRNNRQCAVYVPTAFSPNGDGRNDVFRCRVNDDITAYHLTVYNRWGAVVFSSTDPQQAWDGDLQPAGSYVWVLTYTDSKLQARRQQGSLMLVR